MRKEARSDREDCMCEIKCPIMNDIRRVGVSASNMQNKW